jgi:hypothetical protein
MVIVNPQLTTLRAALVSTAGYLRNVRWEPNGTCDGCAGIPGPGYTRCLPCSGLHGVPHLADRLGFVSYAWSIHQSGHLMHGYKSPQATDQQTRLVRALFSYAIVAHRNCASLENAGLPDAWATVPSLSGRQGQHPLHRVVEPVLRNLPEARLMAAPGATAARGYRPGDFIATPPPGSHVLLVDDTWTSGGRAQGAATALKRDGAAYVTVLVLARWLQPAWSHTGSFITRGLVHDFNPDICPYTGYLCWT